MTVEVNFPLMEICQKINPAVLRDPPLKPGDAFSLDGKGMQKDQCTFFYSF
jgi:hypothetical protein